MKKQPIKIIFWGTPYFSAKILEALIKADFSPILTITAPDKPKGRGLKKQASEAKRMAIKHGLNVSQPQKLKETGFLEQIRALEPDLFVVASYGKIIPKEALEIPKLGCLNVHPSLLPCYRGASPIQTTILNGKQETGVTIMLMDEEMDHGPIISNFQFSISQKITFKELEERLIEESSKLLLKTLAKWINGEIKPMPQNHSQATFCKIIKKEDAKIDFNESAVVIERKVRAFNPWPGTYFEINGKKFKILKADVLTDAAMINDKKPGDIFCINKKLVIQCKESVLMVEKIQPESKNPVDGYAFWCGYQNKLK